MCYVRELKSGLKCLKMKVEYFLRGIGLLIMLVATHPSYAQQDAQYSQYMYNTISVNPAYAGSRGALSVSGLHRNQWLGLDGAPQTQTLSINFPVGFVREVGLGFSVVNDVLGPSSETYFNVDFSYPIQVSRYGTLRFGLKGVGQLLNANLNDLDVPNQNDDNLSDINYKFSPNVGAGLYYYTDQFYLGLSIPNVLETTILESNEENEVAPVQERAHFYFITGYVFDVSPILKFKPAILSKVVEGSPLQLDISANFLLHEKLVFGAAYRWSAAVSALAGFQVSDSILIGFAYDSETTSLGNHNGGSYEVLLRFEVPKKSLRRVTPRFF